MTSIRAIDGNDSTDERKKLVDYALEGFDVALLSISVNNDMYRQRQQNLNGILETLGHKLNTFGHTYEIEYAFIGMKDDGCYDFRKQMNRTNEYMLNKGMDGLMKKVDDLAEVVKIVQKNSSIPTILTIKLRNLKENTVGRLVFIDLLHPRFSQLTKTHDKLYDSFSKLRNAVATITSDKSAKIDLSNTFLTKEMTKYISGHNKLVIFAYLNDIISTEMQARETRFLLDFVTSLKDVPVRMLPNPTQSQINEKLYKMQMARSVQNIEELTQSLAKARNAHSDYNERIAIERKKVSYRIYGNYRP
ncbi:uncharacterized protein EV154DRAFT_187533 [Mucor mucedo]|uniref:uncharacterized protein n=1 Tax=Mucor mucedo TaxID=29922 RepID=UPI00221FBF06|nr:uncharacterized protein EV154DRAFT_187533 [Mucor mucedo]KAI7864212.1 hypothetical protein EV154DRAFT_187533 [Mucor mucedo]